MAKATKGGLGRGLNSLISGSTEEALPAETSQKAGSGAQKEKDEARRPVNPSAAKPVIGQPGGLRDEKTSGTGTSSVSGASSAPVVSGAAGGAGDAISAAGTSVANGGGNASEAKQKSSVTSQDASFPQKSESRNSYYDEDDHVVIKSVKERIVDEISLSLIKPNPDQPRTNFKKEELEELAASIEKDGLLQPIVVRPLGNEYQIIAGERRFQACKILGLKTVPVRLREANDDKALELAMIENIHREDLNPIEEAYGYRRLMDRMGLTQGEVAETVSKGRSTIANAMRLLELPEDAQQLLFEEKISAGHARAILAIPTAEGRQKLTEKMVNEKISVREAESIARLYAGAQNKAGDTEKQPAPKSFKMIARSLRNTLQTSVRVKSVQGKNKIEIEFKDEDDLQRLFQMITAGEAEK